jgi:hypothetical protein
MDSHAHDALKNKKSMDYGAFNKGYIASGLIIRATPGSYDYLVRTPDNPSLICRSLEDSLDKYFGTRSVSTLTERTPVLVFVENKEAQYGFILGVQPTVLHGKPDAGRPTPLAFSLNPESGSSFWSEDAYSTPQLDRDNVSRIIANASRLGDTLPGDWGKYNDFGTALGLFGMVALMKASDSSKLEFHVLDDLVRLVSGQFQHFSALGEHHIYNDGGKGTSEFAGSYNQPELFGEDDYTGGIFNIESADSRDDKYEDCEVRANQKGQTLKRRYQMFFGYMADIWQMFIANPQEGVETYDREALHEGLFHAHLRASGRLDVRSAAGISLQRSDKIPVPKKLKEPSGASGRYSLVSS